MTKKTFKKSAQRKKASRAQTRTPAVVAGEDVLNALAELKLLAEEVANGLRALRDSPLTASFPALLAEATDFQLRDEESHLKACRDAWEHKNFAGLYDAPRAAWIRHVLLKWRPDGPSMEQCERRDEYVEVPLWFLRGVIELWRREERTGKSEMHRFPKVHDRNLRDLVRARKVDDLLDEVHKPFARTEDSKMVYEQANRDLAGTGYEFSAPAIEKSSKLWEKRRKADGLGACYVSSYYDPTNLRGDTKPG